MYITFRKVIGKLGYNGYTLESKNPYALWQSGLRVSEFVTVISV